MSTPTSTVSGLVSGIDWETTIQQLLAIEQRRSSLLQNRKQENETKLSLWAQIQSKILSLQSAAEGIDRRSEFSVKAVSNSDDSIVSVTADASASVGAHSIEVLQLATAHRIASQGWPDQNSTGVGDSGGNMVITIDGQTITIADADLSASTTLEQLKNLINNDSENDNYLTATIIDDGSASNSYRLVLTANDTGVDNTITVTSNPTNLDFANKRIDVAETHQGWTGTSAITTAGTYTGTANKSYSFTVGGSGAQTVGAGDITVNWVDSLGTSGSIVIPNGYAGANIAVAEGVQLSFAAGTLQAGESFDVDVFNPSLTAAQDASLRIDGIYMSPSSNSVNGIIAGVTLDLLSASPGDVVEISISNDKDAVKAKIQGFVDAYNSVMTDLRSFSAYDAENETAAPLLGDGFLSTIRHRLQTASSVALQGLPEGSLFDSLAVVGVRASTNGLLTIDQTDLNAAIDDNFDDVVNLFTQTFSSTDNKLFFIDDDHHTVPGNFTVSVDYDASGNLTAATINGQSAAVDGNIIRGVEGTASEGLVLGWTRPGTGPGSISSTIRFGKGAAGVLAAEAAQISDPDSGTINFAEENLNNSIESLDRQIESWNVRLDAIEKRLRRQFSQLETALSQMRNQSAFLSSVLQ